MQVRYQAALRPERGIIQQGNPRQLALGAQLLDDVFNILAQLRIGGFGCSRCGTHCACRLIGQLIQAIARAADGEA